MLRCQVCVDPRDTRHMNSQSIRTIMWEPDNRPHVFLVIYTGIQSKGIKVHTDPKGTGV